MIRTHASKLRSWKDKAHEYLRKNKVEKALDYYRRVTKAVPDDLSSRLKEGDLLRRLGRYAEAIVVYESVAKAYADDGHELKALAASRLVLEIDPDNARVLDLVAKLHAARVEAIPMRANQEPEPGPTRPALPSIPLFSQLPSDAFVELVQKLETHTYEAGDVIARVGDHATSIFIILEGSVKVTRATDDNEAVVVARMTEGEFFGEVAMLAQRPRSSTIIAAEPTSLFEISKELLDDVISRYDSVEEVLIRCYIDRMLDNISRSSPLFTSLAEEDRSQLVEHFTAITVEADQDILQEGQVPDGLYVMLSGRAMVTKLHAGQRVTVGQLQSGDTFGEMSLMEKRNIDSRIRATRKSVVLRLPRPIFEALAETNSTFMDYLGSLAAARRLQIEAALDQRTIKRIGELMTRDVFSVSRDTTLEQCVDVMRTEEVSCVVVCSGRIPIDIVTERDVARLFAADTADLTDKTPSEIFARPALLVAASEQPVDQTLALMLANGIHQLPVVDVNGNLIGVATQTDLLVYCAGIISGVLNAERALESAVLDLDQAEGEPPGLGFVKIAQRALRCA